MQLGTNGVYVETADYAILGTMTFPEIQRLSDALNAPEKRFLALTEVTMVSKADGRRATHGFLALAVDKIILALPRDAAAAHDDEPLGLAAEAAGGHPLSVA